MTREEAINQLQHILNWTEHHDEIEIDAYDEEAIEYAIKALEQEPVLDKIRAEIEVLPKTYPFVNHFDMYVKEDDVRQIIDKYKAESEEV